MPHGAAGLGDAFDGASAYHRAVLLLQDVRILRPARRVVIGLDQEPRLLPLAGALAHPHQMPAPFQLVAVQRKVEFALGVAPVRIAVGDPAPAIPDHHRAAAVLALRDRAFESVVLDRMIFDVHGEPLFAGHQARTARHRPALHHAIEFEAQIVMQPRGRMFLDHKGIAAALDLPAARLCGDIEAALCTIFFERHGPTRLTRLLEALVLRGLLLSRSAAA